MLSTVRYQLAPFLIPGVVSAGTLFAYDLFFSTSRDKMQCFYDALLLGASHVAVGYITEMLPTSLYHSDYLKTIMSSVLVPALSGILYGYAYKQFFVPSYGGYASSLRLNII